MAAPIPRQEPVQAPHPPIDPTRVRAFAAFFKNYMSVSSVVIAALPIPITQADFIPVFKSLAKPLSTYTSLFCFLLLAYLFYTRHSIARGLFPDRLGLDHPRSFILKYLPLCMILCSMLCSLLYLAQMYSAFRSPGVQGLDNIPFGQIPNLPTLVACYLGIFISAEVAFVMMALKEYLQDQLGLSEIEVIKGNPVGYITFVSFPDGSEVQIGDKYLGHTNGNKLTLELPVGDHNVMFRHTGFQNWERSLTVRHNDCYIVKATHERPT